MLLLPPATRIGDCEGDRDGEGDDSVISRSEDAFGTLDVDSYRKLPPFLARAAAAAMAAANGSVAGAPC